MRELLNSRTLDRMTHTVLFMGKPGAGKGTQSRMLAERTGWHYVSSGSRFREIMEEDTAVARKIRATQNAGYLQPHWIATHLFHQVMFQITEQENLILDGFGRTLPEAEIVDDTFSWLERPYKVMYLHVDDMVVEKRIAKRAKEEDRADDSELKQRLEEFAEKTLPALEFFRAKGIVTEIEGSGDPDEIAEQIYATITQ